MVDEKIERFTRYFADQIAKISEVKESLYLQILWVTLLDALSRAGTPQLGNKNKERILHFVRFTAKWKHCDQVSLPQLKIHLEDKGLKNGKLFRQTLERLNAWRVGELYGPEDDMALAELQPLAYCDCERMELKRCRYVELFYSYRNHLVHGFRPPGHGIAKEPPGPDPFYHSSDNVWELVFPIHVFSQLCNDGLITLRDQLKKEGRNPYDAYDFGFKW